MAKSQLNITYKASASPLEPFLFPKKGCANLKIKHKRLLSLLLVFILTLGMFPTAMAATVDDTDLPAPIEGYDPNDPDNPYPYGLPVTEYIPEDVQNIIDYGVSLMADDNQGSIPDEMWDNAILRALEYTGYDVQRQKDKGQLYQYLYIGSRLKTNDPSVLSDVRVPPECAESYGLQRLFLDRIIVLRYFHRLEALLYWHRDLSAYPFGTWICMCSLLSGIAKRTPCTYRRNYPAFLMPYRMSPALFPLPMIRFGTEIKHIGTHL